MVVAMDTPGFGDSYKPKAQPSIGDYAKAAISLLDGLKIKKTSVVGHHTGAYIGIEIAATQPERVDKLVLSGQPYIDEKTGKEFRGYVPDLFDWKAEKDGSHLMRLWNYFKNRAEPGWPQVPPSVINRSLVGALKAGEGTIQYPRVAISNYVHMADRLRNIQCPTLVIWGTKDLPELSTENKAMIAKLIRRSKEVEVEGGTYLMWHQMPDKLAELVLDFLGEKV